VVMPMIGRFIGVKLRPTLPNRTHQAMSNRG
jgi:hypothetical protein